MKQWARVLASMVLVLGLQTTARADVSAGQPAGTPAFGASTGAMSAGPTAMGGMSMGGAKNSYHPCQVLEEACKSAGFMKGGTATGKGLWKNCIKPLLDGQSVTNVNVESTDIAACKEKVSQKTHH
jgi:hypothetical protein